MSFQINYAPMNNASTTAELWREGGGWMTEKEYLERFDVSEYDMYCPFVKGVCSCGVQLDSMTKYQCVFWSIEDMQCSISAAISKAIPKVVE